MVYSGVSNLFFCLIFSLTSPVLAQDSFKSFVSKVEIKKTLSPTFKLLLWNIQKAEDGKKWEKDFLELLGQYDILTLQEALLNPLSLGIFENLKDYQVDMAISFNYKKQGETGVATLSHASPIRIQAQKSPDTEFWFKTPKTSLMSYYQIEGSSKNLLVINTHALNYDWGSRYKKHLESIATVIQGFDGPVIWSGDFNTWSDHREDICLEVVSKLGLEQVQFKDDKRSTFMFGHIVDRVFIKGLNVVDAKVLEKIKSSDHAPISLELKLK